MTMVINITGMSGYVVVAKMYPKIWSMTAGMKGIHVISKIPSHMGLQHAVRLSGPATVECLTKENYFELNDVD